MRIWGPAEGGLRRELLLTSLHLCRVEGEGQGARASPELHEHPSWGGGGRCGPALWGPRWLLRCCLGHVHNWCTSRVTPLSSEPGLVAESRPCGCGGLGRARPPRSRGTLGLGARRGPGLAASYSHLKAWGPRAAGVWALGTPLSARVLCLLSGRRPRRSPTH